ncbi:bifunctional tRNA (adenosine(37)-N6)-threonylcarbamoyltransferase complex ATPase subunit type 1 TsaE/phosphotransferase [Tersicoccus solisilvae]|uniref:tRNA threonylcarbamoyladenosine biosynthesis protein TsaE n=1 Tax=Tersicoccus solisilvae TaxID=1882339 RepID=A0ABQ1NYY6_9MICC|nr:tRNA (adenosine(37)-N6)-threonylcarbamoyltransferase complex ATPase subunit type 1 TsaE [Tersicoccus solisilvae]GGC85767.1 bifunctional tRNA (adenosine(37)-N6)-threonylcarbamoyltransferase complex ATPase subunit type 1 TsaE/phosphotransferase [Tersicoccus solisilvae]
MSAPPVWTREWVTGSAGQTQALARRIGRALRAGDVLLLSGGLGAGKTTFTQGLGEGLGVRPGIISPTFVLVRIHPNLASGPRPGGPDLVHVDAYRLGSAAELVDLDLESSLDDAVTVIEWGEGMAEDLSDSRLVITLDREVGGVPTPGSDDDADDEEPRTITAVAVGPAWQGREL